MTARRTPPLSNRRRRLVFAVLSILWASGALWLVLHTYFRSNGEFGSVENAMTPYVLKIHAAFAMASLAVLGLVWGVHIVPAWRRGHRRSTGILIVAAFVLLAVTGYLLYYAGDEKLRAATSIVHWLLGLVAIAPFLVHALTKVEPPHP